MAKVIFNGEAGEVWTNESPKVYYQLFASLSNTCATCLQYHHAIGPYWPLPIHRTCRCRQDVVKPGATAQPFVDYRAILDGMSPAQKTKAVGASNYRLLERGVVKWEDVVTKQRVRSFREVVAREKLTVKELTKLGVPEHIARSAYDAVNTSETAALAAHRKLLVERLEDAGLSRAQIRERFAAGVAERVRLGQVGGGGLAGPSVPVAPRPIEPLIPSLGLDAEKVRAALKAKAKAVDLGSDFAFDPPAASRWKVAETLGEADAWGEKHYGALIKGLTEKQRFEVNRYSGSSFDVNDWLRGRTKVKKFGDDLIEALDAVVDAVPLPDDRVLFRGVGYPKPIFDALGITRRSEIEVGMLMIDPGFTSTTLVREKAFDGLLIEIRAPKGTKAAWIGDASALPSEREVILSRKTDVFRVVEVREDAIVVEAMSSEAAKIKPEPEVSP